MTREELKDILKSKTNKLAGEAIQTIRTGGGLNKLQELVEAGAAQLYYERDPQHPRSRFLSHHVLDACFESSFGVVEEKTEETEDGYKIHSATLGDVHKSDGRLEYFKFLLSKEFSPGENSYRGGLFSHIFSSCFYNNSSQKNAREFTKALIAAGKLDIQSRAANSYAWIGHPSHLDFMLELGADPKGSAMIDCALNYAGCSPSGGHTKEDRIEVIKKLLTLGATPEKNLRKAISWQHIRENLEAAGLIEQIAAFGVIESYPPQEYIEWLQRCGKPVPAMAAA